MLSKKVEADSSPTCRSYVVFFTSDVEVGRKFLAPSYLPHTPPHGQNTGFLLTPWHCHCSPGEEHKDGLAWEADVPFVSVFVSDMSLLLSTFTQYFLVPFPNWFLGSLNIWKYLTTENYCIKILWEVDIFERSLLIWKKANWLISLFKSWRDNV